VGPTRGLRRLLLLQNAPLVQGQLQEKLLYMLIKRKIETELAQQFAGSGH
jgi:hypothetical protein